MLVRGLTIIVMTLWTKVMSCILLDRTHPSAFNSLGGSVPRWVPSTSTSTRRARPPSRSRRCTPASRSSQGR